MLTDFTIRPEETRDFDIIEQNLAICFGPERHKRTINVMRANCSHLKAASWVVEYHKGDDIKKIVGNLRFYLCKMPNGEYAPFLGPLAVMPELRGKKLGHYLIDKGLAHLKKLRYGAVLIVGDAGYYAPWGFKANLVSHLSLSGDVAPLTFMGLELQENKLKAKNIQGMIEFVKDPNRQ